MRYRRHHYMAEGINSVAVAAEFMAHSIEEQGHADLIAARIAIQSYNEIIQWLGERDITTRRMLEEILATEEEHADDMATLLKSVEATATTN